MRVTLKRTTFLVVSAAVAGIVLTGCGAKSGDSSSSSGAADQAANKAAAPVAEGGNAVNAEGGAATGADTPAQAPDLSVDQRSIIYRGSISVRVKDDVNAVAGQATGIANTAGGFIGSDNRTSGSEGSGTATMTLRVPADKFTTVVDQLSKLGTEEHREINTEDVTEQTVDLDARIQVQQARVDSGRKLLAQAKSLNDLVMLEKEVASRESDLASLQAKKRRLADLTALSTITVTFLGPVAPGPKPADDQPPGFLGGLSAGWHALLGSLKVLLTVLGALLPWVIALGLPAWGLVYAYRKYWRGRPRAVALATAGAPLPAYAPRSGGSQTGLPTSAPPASGSPASGSPASGSSASGSSASGPSASGPSASGPSASGPSASGPSASGPSASGPSASGRSASGPSGSTQGAAESPASGSPAAHPSAPEKPGEQPKG
ncbi:DUF4349 domain-containing protein [Actinoplanes sp. CA-030573]|uniref:DUF4349 domain-containing protein n=1 Tax=Actinoplanes sp. CA-030573 TaxID=3239898 RepID=UPI003D937C5A